MRRMLVNHLQFLPYLSDNIGPENLSEGNDGQRR